jgi:hypothetical protein
VASPLNPQSTNHTNMLPEKKSKTNLGVGLGILLQITGNVLAGTSEAGAIPGYVLTFIGTVFFVWGCMNYAEGKGHSKWLGLLGLISCLGLVILIFLPDHHKESK